MECNSTSEIETKSIFALLPVEVWWLVLDQVPNPSDLWSCFHANTEWKSIVKSRKHTWTSMQLYQILPLVYTLLSATDMLKLRLVSRKWKKSVDIFLEYDQINQHTSNLRFSGVFEHLRVSSVLHSQKVKLSFKKRANNMPSKTVLDFQLDMDPFARYPAILHTVCVTDCCRQNQRPRFYDLSSFFEQYGVFITNLCLHFRDTPADEFLVYLKNFLRNTPNLKSLSISEHLDLPSNFHCSNDSICLPMLPKLEHLELDVENAALFQVMLENLLLQNTASISMLHIGISSDSDLIILESASCTMKELHLNISEYSNVCFEHVLKTIEHFGKSLKVLKISRAPPVHGSKDILTAIQLPRLETLSLINMHEIFPHLFLFGNLEKLQQLTLHCLGEPWNLDEAEEYIPNRVWDCKEAETELLMGTSKLWKRFPNLKQVKLYQFEGDTLHFDRNRCEKLRQNLCALKHILHTSKKETLRPLPDLVDLLYAPLVKLILLAGAWEYFGVTGLLIVVLLLTFVYLATITYEKNLIKENYRFHSFSDYDDFF